MSEVQTSMFKKTQSTVTAESALPQAVRTETVGCHPNGLFGKRALMPSKNTSTSTVTNGSKGRFQLDPHTS